MEYVKMLSENPAVITGLAMLAALIVTWVISKKPWIKTWMPLVFNIYNMVEAEFPNKPGLKKLKAFMAKFQEEYKKRTGKELTEAESKEVEDAVAMVAYNGEHKDK